MRTNVPEDENTTDVDADDAAPGWDAIEAALEQVHPGRRALHYGTVLKRFMGGGDPLDGVSVYRSDDPVPHWHYVTFGFSELYEKETSDPEVSGYGFELTFRLQATPGEEAPTWPVSLLQNLARYVFGSGNIFEDGHWMTANGPIKLGSDTLIVGMAFVTDPTLPKIDTPNGSVTFLQMVGLTKDEEEAAKTWRPRDLMDLFLPAMPLWITDIDRGSMLDDPEMAERFRAGVARDGSSSGVLFTDVLGWTRRRAFGRGHTHEVRLGASQVEELRSLLPLRLLRGRPLDVVGREQVVQFSPGTSVEVRSEDSGLATVQLTDAALEDLVATVLPVAGEYRVASVPGVVWRVERTEIKDPDGNVVETIG